MLENNTNTPNLSQIGFTANWPSSAKTLITTRDGGKSIHQFAALNLATHVGDNLNHVIKNREIVRNFLPDEPYWLDQSHSNYVLDLDQISHTPWNQYPNHNFDASFTRQKNKVCVVMTADCLPILLTDKQSTFVASIHAGWRGVLNGVIQNTILALKHPSPQDILAYIGPSICQSHFEVGAEVKEQFVRLNPDNERFFQPLTTNNKFACNVTGIAILQLITLGVFKGNIYQSNLCTYCAEKEFFSYRRDGDTGRIASFIWLS